MPRSLPLFLLLCIALSACGSDPLPKRNLNGVGHARWELFDYCRDLAIACAIEIDENQIPDNLLYPKTDLVYRNLSAESALAEIMKRYPGHRWRYRDEILTIAPEHPVENNPLDTPLGPFTFKHTNVDRVMSDVATRANLQGFPHIVVGRWQAQRMWIDYEAPNPSAREVYTKVIKASQGRAAWVVRHQTISTHPLAEIICYWP